MNKKGQILLALILVMTVALAIGLSVIQKSLVDVSTSTKVEQSSMAFSAAEAGIERSLPMALNLLRGSVLRRCLNGYAGSAGSARGRFPASLILSYNNDLWY